MTPTESEIDYFLELYTTRHFTRAAMKLGITQPTLTQSIFRIEEKLNSTLFHRTKQGCVPTQTADIFYERARELKELWQTLTTKISVSEKDLTGVFRVGCHQSVGAYTLPPFFKRLSDRAPGIEIRLQHDWSRRITEKIVSYELDLGFVINPVKHRDLVLIKIGDDTIGFWKARGVTPPKQFFADANTARLREILGKSRMKEFEDWHHVETPSLELIRTLACEGAGVGILPERVAKIEGARLERFMPTLPSRHDEIYLVYRAENLKSAAGKMLIDVAKNCLKP